MNISYLCRAIIFTKQLLWLEKKEKRNSEERYKE